MAPLRSQHSTLYMIFIYTEQNTQLCGRIASDGAPAVSRVAQDFQPGAFRFGEVLPARASSLLKPGTGSAPARARLYQDCAASQARPA